MGLFSALFGNVSETDAAKVQESLAPVLVPGEDILRAFSLVRDLFVFTDKRLILVDKQGLTGSKAEYVSIPYRSVTRFSVETAGRFDMDAELRIWLTGSDVPLSRTFSRGSNIVAVQQVLAACVLGMVPAASR